MVVVVSQLSKFTKSLWSVCLKPTDFIACKSYFINKGVLIKSLLHISISKSVSRDLNRRQHTLHFNRNAYFFLSLATNLRKLQFQDEKPNMQSTKSCPPPFKLFPFMSQPHHCYLSLTLVLQASTAIPSHKENNSTATHTKQRSMGMTYYFSSSLIMNSPF